MLSARPKSAAPSSTDGQLKGFACPFAARYVYTKAASTQGMKAMACILVLCPTWIIWKL